MSQENVEVVREALAAYLRDDEPALRALAASDLSISTRPDQPDVSDHHGLAGLWRASAEWTESWDGHTFEAIDFVDAGDLVLVRARETGRGRASGIPIETTSTFVCTVSAGRIARIQIFGSEAEALEAMGLAD